jgi:S-adenosylmethionine uptake transporter
MRGILGAASFFLYTYSVIYLPLVEVVTILWTIPLFVIILSIFFLGEKISTVRWAATLIGFLGLSFITLYNSDASFSLRLLYIAPIASAFLFAVQDVMIKKVVDNESKITMLLYFAMVAGAISFFPALLVWRTPTTREYFMLFLLGANGNLMQYFIFKAFSAADLSALAPFRYVEFLLSAVFAFIFFAEVPGTNVLVGALILIPSTLYLTASEKRRNCCSA